MTASKLDLIQPAIPAPVAQLCLQTESRTILKDSKDSCLGIETQDMEITLKSFPLKVVNIPWRNNNLSTLRTDTPLSEQGETIIGVYLLVLGKTPFVGKLLDTLCSNTAEIRN